MPQIYSIAEHPITGMSEPISGLPFIADGIVGFLSIGLFTGILCLFLVALSFLKGRRS